MCLEISALQVITIHNVLLKVSYNYLYKYHLIIKSKNIYINNEINTLLPIIVYFKVLPE